ncbi:hypothetical protein [Sphingopyxis sp.]|uniref:hypothetical protein n=1 Tax=Sphingopyxis sp. TaxID=1908224 RepID=UPI002ED7826F
MPKYFLAAVAALASLSVTADLAAADQASGWEIGPIIRGKNLSPGMPARPMPTRGGWYFDFPVGSAAAGHVHYVTGRTGALAGTSRIVMRYRIDAEPGTRFVAQENPRAPATVSIYLQRRGDNWTGRGRYQYYRWYAPVPTVRELAPGEHEISVRLDDPYWISVAGRNAIKTPGAMEDAIGDLDRIGLVFGTTAHRGHGVFATRPARFTLLSFEIR